MRWFNTSVRTIPVPPPSGPSDSRYRALDTLSTKIETELGGNITAERIAELDSEVDRLVQALYGLGEDDIKVIEEWT